MWIWNVQLSRTHASPIRESEPGPCTRPASRRSDAAWMATAIARSVGRLAFPVRFDGGAIWPLAESESELDACTRRGARARMSNQERDSQPASRPSAGAEPAGAHRYGEESAGRSADFEASWRHVLHLGSRFLDATRWHVSPCGRGSALTVCGRHRDSRIRAQRSHRTRHLAGWLAGWITPRRRPGTAAPPPPPPSRAQLRTRRRP